MRYLALASDYDGTLAKDGQVSEATLAALQRLRESGHKLILVTGRELGDLKRVLPQVDWFDCVVAENGALVYYPTTDETVLLGQRPPDEFIQALQDQEVEPISVGQVIVATWEPHQTTVLETLHRLGLAHQVILNKGAVMVLPPGVNKAAGLRAALEKLGLPAQAVVGVGDAENDQALLETCGFGVAVANALPSLKAQADWVTEGSRGAGVAELIGHLVASDLGDVAPLGL
jgi:phosphoglycolate phosphatase (TIGR01487 family)